MPPTEVRSLTRQPIPAWTHQERMYLSTEHIELLLALGRGDYTMLFDPSKREALLRIASAFLAASQSSTIGSFAMSDPEPWERLSRAKIASSPPTILNEATLAHFEQLLTISWQLCDQNQLTTADGVLGSFLPQLLLLPKHDSGTASLTSQSLYLHSILAHHHLKFSDKVRICEQGVSYAREAGNVNTLVTALIELAVAYDYGNMPEMRLKTLQEALDQSRQATPLVQSDIYSHYAVTLAESGRIREAEILYRTRTGSIARRSEERSRLSFH